MRDEQSGIMFICGLLGLMMLLMFSSGIAFLIVIPFGMPESYLAPVSLGSMVGLIILFVYYASQEDKKIDRERMIAKEKFDLHWKKRALFFMARDFDDSRKNIKQRAEWAERSKRYCDLVNFEPVYSEDDESISW